MTLLNDKSERPVVSGARCLLTFSSNDYFTCGRCLVRTRMSFRQLQSSG